MSLSSPFKLLSAPRADQGWPAPSKSLTNGQGHWTHNGSAPDKELELGCQGIEDCRLHEQLKPAEAPVSSESRPWPTDDAPFHHGLVTIGVPGFIAVQPGVGWGWAAHRACPLVKLGWLQSLHTDNVCMKQARYNSCPCFH